MNRYTGSDEFRGAEFVDADLTGATFREVDLSGARMRGVLLFGANLDGAINGLVVNGVEVAPLIEAELDRRHPERTGLRPSTAEGMRAAWGVVESFWGATMARAAALPAGAVHRSVDGEWSFTQTLRHLVFVTDAWLGHAVLRDPAAFHPLGIPPRFITDAAVYGIDAAARPEFPEVVAARADRTARVRDYVAGLSQADLDVEREPNTAPGWPPPAVRTAAACLRVILNEEWAHHQFAIRDLAALDG